MEVDRERRERNRRSPQIPEVSRERVKEAEPLRGDTSPSPDVPEERNPAARPQGRRAGGRPALPFSHIVAHPNEAG